MSTQAIMGISRDHDATVDPSLISSKGSPPSQTTPCERDASPLMDESMDDVLDENGTPDLLQFDRSISINENGGPAVVTESAHDEGMVDAERDRIAENGSLVGKGDADKEGSLPGVEPAGHHDGDSVDDSTHGDGACVEDGEDGRRNAASGDAMDRDGEDDRSNAASGDAMDEGGEDDRSNAASGDAMDEDGEGDRSNAASGDAMDEDGQDRRSNAVSDDGMDEGGRRNAAPDDDGTPYSKRSSSRIQTQRQSGSRVLEKQTSAGGPNLRRKRKAVSYLDSDENDSDENESDTPLRDSNLSQSISLKYRSIWEPASAQEFVSSVHLFTM